MRWSVDAVQIVKDLGKGIKRYDARMEGERRCLMKIIIMTEAARESCSLLKAIEDGMDGFTMNIVKSYVSAASRVSSESEQEIKR